MVRALVDRIHDLPEAPAGRCRPVVLLPEHIGRDVPAKPRSLAVGDHQEQRLLEVGELDRATLARQHEPSPDPELHADAATVDRSRPSMPTWSSPKPPDASSL